MAKQEKPGKALETLKYEEAFGALEDVVKQLETGNGTLEEMISLYERGMELVRHCNARLDAYETKITKLAEIREAENEQDC